MGILSRLEVVDPQIPDKPLAKISVPGTVTPEQLRKEIRIGLTIKIDLGDKTRKKTVTIKIFDEELKKKLEEYINNIQIRIYEIESEERIAGELKMAEIKSE